MNKKILSVGIPTYKRANELSQVLDQIVKSKVADLCNVYVIDDGPSDNMDEVINLFKNKITFTKHQINEGYAFTFIELIEQCDTEYIMLSVDDDFINDSELMLMEKYLADHKPDFISSAWMKNDKIHRGKTIISDITFQEVGPASIHAPGLIYKVESVKPLMSFLKNRLKNDCTATYFMPQVVLVFLLKLLDKKCIWHPAKIVSEGFSAPSQIIDGLSNHYASFIGRYKSTISFISLFDELSTNSILSDNAKKKAVALKNQYEAELYKRVTTGLKNDYIKEIWMGAAFVNGISQPLKSLKQMFVFLSLKRKNQKLLK